MHAYLEQLTVVDLTKIDDLNPNSVLRIIAEVGTDIGKWPSVKNFLFMARFVTMNKNIGRKVLSTKKPSANRAAALLRISAITLHNSQSALGAFLCRQKSRLGVPKEP
jgi:hypothetical protein